MVGDAPVVVVLQGHAERQQRPGVDLELAEEVALLERQERIDKLDCGFDVWTD